MKLSEIVNLDAITEEAKAWQSKMDEAISSPSFIMPAGMTREERREWARKIEAGEIKPNEN